MYDQGSKMGAVLAVGTRHIVGKLVELWNMNIVYVETRQSMYFLMASITQMLPMNY